MPIFTARLTDDQLNYLKVKLEEYMSLGFIHEVSIKRILVYEKTKNQFEKLLLDTSTEIMGFNTRALEALKRNDIRKLGDFMGVTYGQFRKTPRCGEKTIKHIRLVLEKNDIILKEW
jgi:DNA-directed RNA polymerase alpha subunit